MLKLIQVSNENSEIAKTLQAKIFPHDKSPEQVDFGIKTENPLNYIAFSKNQPVGIVGFYFKKEFA